MRVFYEANAAAVAHETFDEETVLINFERGTYFSLRASAPLIWSLVQSPASLDAILACLAECHDALPDDAPATIAAMLENLHDEGCILKQSAAGTTTLPSLPHAGSFAAPAIQAFHDLQELIVVDPVHEVQEFDGWPHRPPAFTLG